MISVSMLAGMLMVMSGLTGGASSGAKSVEVSLDQTRISTSIGQRLTVQSRVTNTGATPTDRLVAHLNVASLDGVYVDLEDWSADVTRQLAALAPGASAAVSWQFQAVNVGTFDVYVVVMPNGADPAVAGPLVASPPVHVTVAGKQTLNPGGSLPVIIVIPMLLGLAVVAVRYRVRRTA